MISTLGRDRAQCWRKSNGFDRRAQRNFISGPARCGPQQASQSSGRFVLFYLKTKTKTKKTKRKTRTKTKTLEVRLDVDLSRPPSLQEGLYRFTIRQRQRQSECLVSFTEMCFKCTFRELAFSREVSGRGTTNPNFVYTCKYAFVPTFNATVTINTAALQWLC